MKEQLKTVDKIEQAMRQKVKKLIPVFKNAPPTQTVRSTQGELVEKANPALQEIRALFKDYVSLVKEQKGLNDKREAPEAAQKTAATVLEIVRAKHIG